MERKKRTLKITVERLRKMVTEMNLEPERSKEAKKAIRRMDHGLRVSDWNEVIAGINDLARHVSGR